MIYLRHAQIIAGKRVPTTTARPEIQVAYLRTQTPTAIWRETGRIVRKPLQRRRKISSVNGVLPRSNALSCTPRWLIGISYLPSNPYQRYYSCRLARNLLRQGIALNRQFTSTVLLRPRADTSSYSSANDQSNTSQRRTNEPFRYDCGGKRTRRCVVST